MTEYWYRYYEMSLGDNQVKLCLDKEEVLRHTPKGVWLAKGFFFGADRPSDLMRWVSNSTRKRYAYPTQKEAMVGFYHRKCRQKLIMESRLGDVKIAITLAKEAMDTGKGFPEPQNYRRVTSLW
jgi:hypothetical protein